MKLLYKPNDRKSLVVLKKKKVHPNNLGKKGFVMDRKSFLNWYDW